LNSDALFSLGRATEVTRDEVKFAKFITRLRSRFSTLFTQILEKQVVLKGIMSIEDWQKISSQIKYEYAKDNYFTELKNTEILQNRAQLLMSFEQGNLLGKYYSYEWARRTILHQSKEDIEEQDSKMEEEENSGDPRWINQELQQQMMQQQDQDQSNQQQDQDQQPDQNLYASGASTNEPSEATTNERKSKAQATIDRVSAMNPKLRTLKDTADYRSALQVIAKNK